MFIFSTIKCELVKRLYNITLRKLLSGHGDFSVNSSYVLLYYMKDLSLLHGDSFDLAMF